MNTDFETPMAALLAHFQATTAISFTANSAQDSAVLTSVGNFAGLFPGLPVVGPGVGEGVTIASLNPGEATLTLSDAVCDPVTFGAFQAGFQTFGRRLIRWSEVDAQPALFLRRIGAMDQYDHDSSWSITTLDCEAWLYCRAGADPDTAPDTGLTALERLVRQSMAFDDPGGDARFTIGGLVYWCRVEGKTDSSPGDQAGQAISRIPIRITLP